MPVQRQKQLPVRKKPGYLVGRVHRQGCLTDSRHATYRVNFYHAVSVGGRLLKLPQLFISAGKRSGGTRQGPDYCGSVRTPESCGLEILALVTGQVKRISYPPRGVLARRSVDAPLQIAYRAGADPRNLRQFLLRQPRFTTELPQHLTKATNDTFPSR